MNHPPYRDWLAQRNRERGASPEAVRAAMSEVAAGGTVIESALKYRVGHSRLSRECKRAGIKIKIGPRPKRSAA